MLQLLFPHYLQRFASLGGPLLVFDQLFFFAAARIITAAAAATATAAVADLVVVVVVVVVVNVFVGAFVCLIVADDGSFAAHPPQKF